MSIVPRVRTVLGEIDSATLGRTYCHEHLLTRPAPRFTADGPDMVLDDEDRSAVELATLKEAGGHALVEASTPEFGRDASGLRRLSERSGVHVVCCTGHVYEETGAGSWISTGDPRRSWPRSSRRRSTTASAIRECAPVSSRSGRLSTR
jgi:predicted metal-dependent phosphotriesterase family hydrolase